MFVFYDWPFAHLCILCTVFSLLILGSVLFQRLRRLLRGYYLPYCTGDAPHDTDTSSVWSQSWISSVKEEQLNIDVSSPTHAMLSSHIGPVPGPYRFPITVPLYLKFIQHSEHNVQCIRLNSYCIAACVYTLYTVCACAWFINDCRSSVTEKTE